MIHALQELIKRGINISTPDVITALNMANKGNLDYFTDMYEEEIIKDRNGKPIRAKMPDKRNILKPSEPMMSFWRWTSRNRKDVSCRCHGHCGIEERTSSKIILTRPAVEAGENLGFYQVI